MARGAVDIQERVILVVPNMRRGYDVRLLGTTTAAEARVEIPLPKTFLYRAGLLEIRVS